MKLELKLNSCLCVGLGICFKLCIYYSFVVLLRYFLAEYVICVQKLLVRVHVYIFIVLCFEGVYR